MHTAQYITKWTLQAASILYTGLVHINICQCQYRKSELCALFLESRANSTEDLYNTASQRDQAYSYPSGSRKTTHGLYTLSSLQSPLSPHYYTYISLLFCNYIRTFFLSMFPHSLTILSPLIQKNV